MDRLISEQAIEKALKQNTVLGEFIEKQVEKNIKMREYWTNVFSNELIDRMSVIRAINDAYDETEDKESYRDKVTHKMMAIPSAELCESCCNDNQEEKAKLCQKSYLAGMEHRDKWIPVSERLPEDKQSVLVWCPQYKNIYCAYLEKKQWWIFGAFVQIVPNEVVEWMPLPKRYEPQERSE